VSATEFKLQRVGDLALVTIDNGEDWTKPSTFGREALESLERTLDDLESQEWAGLVLTGKPYVFAVGADIDQFPNVTPELARAGSRAGHDLFLRIRELPFPTLAAINGAALGGGLEIALACDIIVAAEHATLGLPEPRVGLMAAAGGVHRLPRHIPLKVAMGMMLTGKPITAAEGANLGLVNEVVPKAQLTDAAARWAREIAACAPLSVQASKQAALQGLGRPLVDALAGPYESVERLWASDDAREGPLAFAQKRRPQWTGK
jgi:enoyl-CoA hydratase/carnithine racemase